MLNPFHHLSGTLRSLLNSTEFNPFCLVYSLIFIDLFAHEGKIIQDLSFYLNLLYFL